MRRSTTNIWDVQHIKLLLLQPTTLLREEPFSDWICAHGGLSAIYEHLRAVRLPPKLFRLCALLLEEASPPPYATLARCLHVSRKTVYRHMGCLALELASALNELDGALTPPGWCSDRSSVRHAPGNRRIASSA
jgi:hypothetical protein